jgi:hypothetical protein
MNDQIPWWQSRTIWALVVSIAVQAINATGKHIDPDLQGTIVDTLMQIASAVAAGVGVYYRVKTTATIITPSNPPAPKVSQP